MVFKEHEIVIDLIKAEIDKHSADRGLLYKKLKETSPRRPNGNNDLYLEYMCLLDTENVRHQIKMNAFKAMCLVTEFDFEVSKDKSEVVIRMNIEQAQELWNTRINFDDDLEDA